MIKTRNFQSFNGIVKMINDFRIKENDENEGCYKMMSVEDNHGNIVNFVVAPTTYFVDGVMVRIGDMITGFYDADAPVPLIYPPQFRAIIMALATSCYNVKVSYFNNELVSSDNMLSLNIGPFTQIVLENGQIFTRYPGNRELIVIYGPTTRSIPAQTAPYKIIIICPMV
jgi:hypothetical protein